MTKLEIEERKEEIQDFIVNVGISLFDDFFMDLLKSNPMTEEKGTKLKIVSEFCWDHLDPTFSENVFSSVEEEIINLLAENFTAEELQNCYNVY